MQERLRTDVVVVGGGVVGWMVAHRLAAAADLGVTVIDRDLVALGASARSAGMHFPTGRTEVVREMAHASQIFYETFAAARPALRWRRVRMRVHAPTAEPRWLERFTRQSRVRPARDAGPVVPSRPERSAFDVDGANHADVGQLARTLATELHGRVARIEGVGVATITERDDGIAFGLTTGDTLLARAAVLAPGPWAASPPFAPLTEPLGVRTKRIVALHVAAPVAAEDAAELLIAEDAFLLPIPWLGAWLFSYTCEDWDVDPDACVGGVAPAHLAEATALLHGLAPSFVDRVRGGRVFCDAYSPDRAPLVAPVGAGGRMLFVGACNGSGYRLAPAIAQAAVERLTHLLPSEIAA
ncbi:FAD-dependent oxidoreductase [Salinarimonas sp.]|uniref:FAD-dependent oxidoreductase n=1 Tax=Salinarimonas sp. TaxID=2766526 RepID=UPI0032D8DF26